MPTPAGLPKVGEVWEKRIRLPGQPVVPTRVVILERTGGSYWAVRVARKEGGRWRRDLWVDASYHFQQQQFKYIGPASPKVRAELGLPPAKKRDLTGGEPTRKILAAEVRNLPSDLPPGSYDVTIGVDTGWRDGQFVMVLEYAGPHDPDQVTAFTIDVGEKK